MSALLGKSRARQQAPARNFNHEITPDQKKDIAYYPELSMHLMNPAAFCHAKLPPGHANFANNNQTDLTIYIIQHFFKKSKCIVKKT